MEQLSKSTNSRIVIKKNPLLNEVTSSSNQSSKEASEPNMMSVMIADVGTNEERIFELEKKMSKLIKAIKERL